MSISELFMPDERLDALGESYTHQNVGEHYGITFERYVYLNNIGAWHLYANHAV